MKNKKEFVDDFAYLMVRYFQPFNNQIEADEALTDVLKLLKEKYNKK